MSKNIIFRRLFIAGFTTCLVILLCASPGVTPVHAQPPKTKVTVKKKAKIDLDLAAVAAFFKDVKKTIKRHAKKSAPHVHDFSRGIASLPKSWCRKTLKLSKDFAFEECMVRDVSNKRAAIVIVVKGCEPEHCEVDYWIVSDKNGPRPSPVWFEDAPVVTHDRRYMFTGHTGMESHKSGYIAYLTRITLATLKTEAIASCAAPTLSPSGRWVVCRDADGHVHRLPVQGGDLERVHTIDLGKDRIYSDAHMGVNLAPVTFIKKNRIRITTLTADDKEDIEEFTWIEGKR